jgi:hypothetical protein
MDPSSSSELQKKGILIAAIILFVLIVAFIMLSFKNNVTQKNESKNDTTSGNGNLATSTETLSPFPSFSPPEDAKFPTVDSVYFIPNSINGYKLDKEKLHKTGVTTFPTLAGKLLQDQINKTIFTWLALNDFYSKEDPSKVTASYKKKEITDMALINKEVIALKKVYVPNIISMDGLFLKVRFAGTVQSNLDKLHLNEAALQSTARQLIEQYKKELETSPKKEDVLSNFNKNNTILLLNNRETSRTFKNYPMYPPLFLDVNFYSIMESLPVDQVSDIFTLRQKMNGESTVGEYAYAVFYVTKKTGTYKSVETVTNAYVQNSKLE